MENQNVINELEQLNKKYNLLLDYVKQLENEIENLEVSYNEPTN